MVQDTAASQAPRVSSKWFCNSCHSLNARGAKRCYSCGAREDYLGLDALTGVPPEAKPEQPGAAGRGSAGDAIAALASTSGSIEFADERAHALPQGRTRPRNVAAIALSAMVLIAVIVAAAVLAIGHGPATHAAVGPEATPTPFASSASAAPTAGALTSPAASGRAVPKPNSSGVPATAVGSAAPSVAPLPTATSAGNAAAEWTRPDVLHRRFTDLQPGRFRRYDRAAGPGFRPGRLIRARV